MNKGGIVYTTAISTPIRNAFNAWVAFLAEKATNEAKRKKAKKKVADESEATKSRALFIGFTSACDREGRDFKAVAESLRKEAQ